MREVVLGTAGHVDHGKTSLVKALTGINTDRLQEEQERGITIELGFAFLDLPCGHRLGIVDVPGHEKFVKNMVAGAAGIDLVALIIAADEGIMPQTREHFEICQLLGVAKGCVIITKKDMVEEEWLDLVVEETKDYLAGSFLEDAPIVTVSSTTGDGLEDVKNALDKLVSSCAFPDTYGPFRLPVDRIFTMKGFGSVVTGTSMSGRLQIGDDIEIYPSNLTGKIRGIQVHGQQRQEVEAGYRTAINIQGVAKEQIERGDVISSPNSLMPTYIIDAGFHYLSSNSKKLKNRARVRIHIGTAEIMGRIVLLENEVLQPGDNAIVQLLLEKPVGIWPGDRYVIRSYSPVMTIGGGDLYANVERKKQRLKGINHDIFRLYKQGEVEEKILLHLQQSGQQGLTPETLAIKMGLFAKRLKKVLSAPISAKKILIVESDRQRMISSDVFQVICDNVEKSLALFHQKNPLKPGIVKEELNNLLRITLDGRLLQYTLNEMQKKKLIAFEEAYVHLASHQVALQQSDEELRQGIIDQYQQAGLKPPRVKELKDSFSDFSVKQIGEILEVLSHDKLLTRVSEDLYFATANLTSLRQSLIEHLQKQGEIDAQGFKELTGATRKFSIPLLEYFDRQKVTIRIGDKRQLRSKS